MSNTGWSLPAMPIVPVSPIQSTASKIGEAIQAAPQTAADQTAKLAKTQADTAEDQQRKAAAPALGASTIADAQNKTIGSNVEGLKQYAQILRSSPAAASSPLVQAALKQRFGALGLEVPMKPDGSGVDVDAMEALASPQPMWTELGADDLKKWEQQPESVRRAKFPDAPEAWLSKPVTVPMTAAGEQQIYTNLTQQLDAVGKGALQPSAFLSVAKSARERLKHAEMSTAGVDQYLNPDGTDLADGLKDQIVGEKTNSDIQHYRDLGIHYQDEDALKTALNKEHMREFDKNYGLNARKVTVDEKREQDQAANMARVASQGADRLAQGWQAIQLRQQEFGLNANRLQQADAFNKFKAYDGDFKTMSGQLETNKRAIQTAANLGHPVKPDSDLFQSTVKLQQILDGTPGDGANPPVPGLRAQVDAMRTQFVQQPAADLSAIGGHPAKVTDDGHKPGSDVHTPPGPGYKLQTNASGQHRWFNPSTGKSVNVP